MQTAEVVISHVDRLHRFVMLQRLTVGIREPSEPLNVLAILLIEALGVRSANLVMFRLAENAAFRAGYYRGWTVAVSYTHLTLPTNREV